MLNLKKCILLTILFSLILPCLHADEEITDEEKRSSLFYLKLGAVRPPADSVEILPNLGLGARFQRGYRGFDLSLNLGSEVLFNYASVKGLYLYYPTPETRHQLYWGVGPGVGIHLNVVPRALGGTASVNIEGMVGCEFRHFRYLKTFIQLELSQPTIYFGPYRKQCSYMPGVALNVGIGF